jgi:hypothetical protein
MLVKDHRGKDANVVWRFDAALVAQINDTLKQAAIEDRQNTQRNFYGYLAAVPAGWAALCVRGHVDPTQSGILLGSLNSTVLPNGTRTRRGGPDIARIVAEMNQGC